MNERSLNKLEYYKVIELLKKKASSSLGKDFADQLRPKTNLYSIKESQAETSEAVLIMRYEGSMPLAGIVDTYDALSFAQKSGLLNLEDLGRIRQNLYAAKNISTFFKKNFQYELPLLKNIASKIQPLRDLELDIEKILDDENQVKDSASDLLWSLRRKKKTLQERIKNKLDSMIRNPNTLKYLQENIVTSRQGRYVLPVKVEYRQYVPGMIHDQSASGATLFVEPAAVVNYNNDLKKVELEEQEEIKRILQEISEKVALEATSLRNNLYLLSRLDFIMAKAGLSTEMEAIEPEIEEGVNFKVQGARHPLIPLDQVVAINIELGHDFDALIITGPNTGGKTVSIKTSGLFVLMAQSGLHLPAEKAQMGIFNKVYCDIGDEQSIEQSLSTFSSHMTNIIEIIDEADDKSLILLDELGAGTDPSEGANLAIAIINYFLKEKSKIIATTHYGDLKLFAYNTDRVENASVEFDTVSLKPTYRLLIGVPGRSNALEIARRLGLKDEIILSAQSMVSHEEEDVTDLIEKLEKEAFYGQRNFEESQLRLAEAEERLAQVELMQKELIEKEANILKKAQEEAYKIVRQAREETQEKIKEIREIEERDRSRALEAAHSFRKEMEEMESGLYKDIVKKPRVHELISDEELTPGMEVFLPKFNQKGIVLEIEEEEVFLQLGIIKMKVDKKDITIPEQKKEKVKKSGLTKLKDEKVMSVKTEIDLRGLTVEEAETEVDKYLDDARLAGLAQVSLIHGKGTGALRLGLSDFLRAHPSVKRSRLGSNQEGGHGVTIVEIK